MTDSTETPEVPQFDLATLEGVTGLLRSASATDNPFSADDRPGAEARGAAFVAFAHAVADLVDASAGIKPSDPLQFAATMLSALGDVVQDSAWQLVDLTGEEVSNG